MKFYKFISENDFKQWHKNIKETLGIPNENTLEYTGGIVVASDDIRAQIEEIFSEGLEECPPPPEQTNSWESYPYRIIY